jgi:hypothetical protein
MEPIGSPETSVLNYLTPRKNPEEEEFTTIETVEQFKYLGKTVRNQNLFLKKLRID